MIRTSLHETDERLGVQDRGEMDSFIREHERTQTASYACDFRCYD
jgi:hypothetical protein